MREVAIRDLLRITGVPANERQLAGLRARRDELRSQLESATDERSSIQERLTEDQDAATQRLLRQQLDATSRKVLSLDDAIATTERQIAAAPPELLAATQAVVPPAIDVSRLVPQEQANVAAFSTFGLGVVLTLLASRWRRVRRGGSAGAPRPDPQIQQLAVAVDAIALEVERIGEGQRFVTQLLAERDAAALAPRTARDLDVTVEAPLSRGAPGARVPTPH